MQTGRPAVRMNPVFEGTFRRAPVSGRGEGKSGG